MKIQDIIKNRRFELGLTLKDVSKALGVSEGTVSRYESGEIQNMGIDKVEALARVLCCSPGYLMGWEDYPSSPSDPGSEILRLFCLLNDKGKEKLIERAKELLELGYKNE